MKVIEGHFNPLKRPDRTIYPCHLTEKVQLDSDERGKEGYIERTRQQRPGWSLSQSNLNIHQVRTRRAEIIYM